MKFSVAAFMTCFNEADIIVFTIQHLINQGIGVYVIDNWSTDGSPDLVREFPLVGFEKFPADGPSQYYSWRPLLTRVEELAAASTASWCIHHDADEIRKSPVPDESLKDAFVRVQAAGYNAVDHQVLQFYPTDDLYTGDPERHFQSFTLDHLDSKLHHVKAWRNTQRVNLTSSGGHIATFPGMHVYPERFVLKHYPIRGSVQGARKVLQERIARYDPAERAMNWHQQYEELVRTHQWVKKSNDILVG